MKTVAEMRMVGGHPCLDFVNTVDSRGDRWGPDLLVAYADLVAWAVRAEVIDRIYGRALLAEALRYPDKAKEALEFARELREALYSVLRAEATGARVPKAALSTVAEAVHLALPMRMLACDGDGLKWAWIEADNLDAIAHRLAFEGADFLTGRDGRRAVRECPGPNCGWLFLDTSRGGHRRWCSDASCGTRSRVERFRLKPVVPEGGKS